MVKDRVVDPVTDQQGVCDLPPPLFLLGDAWYLGVLNMRKTSPNRAPIAGFWSGNLLQNYPVPESENKCLNIALFAKIRLYWA